MPALIPGYSPTMTLNLFIRFVDVYRSALKQTLIYHYPCNAVTRAAVRSRIGLVHLTYCSL